jgi:hypothetical protein
MSNEGYWCDSENNPAKRYKKNEGENCEVAGQKKNQKV